MEIKIQSISDIITNSSSEVFTIYTEESLNAIKKLVNSILELAGDDKKFDDYFTIDFRFSETGLNDVKYDNPTIKNEDKLKRIALKAYKESIKNGEAGWYVDGIIVTPKDPKSEKAAKLIENIENIFDHKEMYC